MKILYIITRADEIGGAQTHLRDMSEQLLIDGHDVEVIVGETGALVNYLQGLGVKVNILQSLVREISPFKDIKCVKQIREIIKNFSPDIIALHSSKAGIVGRLAAIGTKVPVIFTAHGWSFADGVNIYKKKAYITIEKFFSPLANKIITVSEQDKKLSLKYNVASESKQVVIHNGIPVNNHIVEKNNDEKTHLISVARFSEQKDHETLLKALSLLKTTNWDLTLVGKGPRLQMIKDLADELLLSDKIIFTGERIDIDDLLGTSDVFLLISNWEGFPISILEAMRAGLPVIASNVGGVSEAVSDSKTGFLVERADVYALKDKIESLVDDEEKCRLFGTEGRRVFLEKFSFNAMYIKTLTLYKEVVRSGKI